MKKTIIAALVGGLILFFWQFLSNAALDLHRSMQNYTPKQQEIMDFMNKQFTEDGFYMLPMTTENASHEETVKAMEQSLGKPWMEIYYHKEMKNNMPTNMARGLIIDILAVFLLCWFLLKGAVDMKTTLISCIVFGVICYLTTQYTHHIWYETKTIPDFVDAIVGWGAVGLWLGWWLPRK
jgi:hypothetical protein